MSKTAEMILAVAISCSMIMVTVGLTTFCIMHGIAEMEAAQGPAKCLEMIMGFSGELIEGTAHGSEL